MLFFSIHNMRASLQLLIFMLLPAVSIGNDVVMQDDSSEELCAPFKHRDVDKSALQHMLDAAAKGNLYRIEPTSSTMGFCVETPIGMIEGKFKSFKGGFTLDNAAAGANEQAMMVVETGSLEAPAGFIENMLESEDFFNSDDYPEFIFVSTGFYWVNEKEAILIGDLTIRDVTRSVGFHVELTEKDASISKKGQRIQVKASTKIRRSEFGIISLSPIVSDDVTLCMRVEALRYASLQ
jgi:polyisoprenoid-binding protein YceI